MYSNLVTDPLIINRYKISARYIIVDHNCYRNAQIVAHALCVTKAVVIKNKMSDFYFF